jgi:two-component system LytT family sensor kinase
MKIFKSRVFVTFLICTIVTLFFLGQNYYFAILKDVEFIIWDQFSYQAFFYYSWGALYFVIIFLTKKFPLEKNTWAVNLPIHIVAAFVLAVIQKYVSAIVYFWFSTSIVIESDLFTKYIYKAIGSAFDGVVYYFLILGIHIGIDYYKQLTAHKIKAAKLESQLANAQLSALKMQLHPHFLFNTMHAISSLMEEDVKTAQRMLTKLSDLLRQTLEFVGIQHVSLEQELDFLKSYLEIEQTRFHDRLKINYDIDSKTLNAQVPNLILQPMVENAIKHGITPKAEGGTINISAKIENENLILEISDNGKGNGNEEIKEGIGIKNTRKRLNQIYADKFLMDISSQADKGFSVKILIPYEEFIQQRDENDDQEN